VHLELERGGLEKSGRNEFCYVCRALKLSQGGKLIPTEDMDIYQKKNRLERITTL
jgi:hypothetical protein